MRRKRWTEIEKNIKTRGFEVSIWFGNCLAESFARVSIWLCTIQQGPSQLYAVGWSDFLEEEKIGHSACCANFLGTPNPIFVFEMWLINCFLTSLYSLCQGGMCSSFFVKLKMNKKNIIFPGTRSKKKLSILGASIKFKTKFHFEFSFGRLFFDVNKEFSKFQKEIFIFNLLVIF